MNNNGRPHSSTIVAAECCDLEPPLRARDGIRLNVGPADLSELMRSMTLDALPPPPFSMETPRDIQLPASLRYRGI